MPKKPDTFVMFEGSYLGAIENGARIVKQNSEDGDGHPDGSTGAVLSSIGHASVGVAYFIEWDDAPGLPVLTVANKIRRLQ